MISLTATPGDIRDKAAVIDLFCGAGGLAHGFLLEGVPVKAGLDSDPDCRFPFETNNGAKFICEDIRSVSPADLNVYFANAEFRILVGCAPCQPFSTYNQNRVDPQWSLVDVFADLICETRPDVVSMENVPRLATYASGTLFRSFKEKLKNVGYFINERVVYLPDFGLPQRRLQLVVLASLHGDLDLEEPSYSPKDYRTVSDAIASLAKLEAGQADPNDRLHKASSLSPTNLARLRASRPGGTWRDWDVQLRAPCHTRKEGNGYGAVYGRMPLDEPAPTITTQFYNFGSGRFGHPTQDRALTLREGALLQSFPPTYEFVHPKKKINVRNVGRLIGNAVPVTLGRVIARSICRHLSAVDRERYIEQPRHSTGAIKTDGSRAPKAHTS